MPFLGLEMLYDATKNEKPVQPAEGHVRAPFESVLLMPTYLERKTDI
jgi:hypothetical protein